MSARMFLSLVPSVSDEVSAIEAEVELREAMGVLVPVARMLAQADGIPGNVRRAQGRALRAETTALRSAILERREGRTLADVESAADLTGVHSGAMVRQTRTGGLEEAVFESLVESLDLPRLLDTGVIEACTDEACAEIGEQLEVVSNLLDVALAREHVLPPGSDRVSYFEVVEEAARTTWDAARTRGVSVTCSVATTTGSGDADMLRRMLTTLLHEAVLSTPEGGAVVLDVSGDTIPVLELEMDAPLRAKNPLSPMCGLELAFSAAVVRAHGGELTQDEVAGKTFVRFALPRRVIAPARRAA